MKLTSDVVKEISSIKNEPSWMTDFRLKSLMISNQLMVKYTLKLNVLLAKVHI